MEKCPICGSSGKDMVFAFYCSNKECQNFNTTQDEEVEVNKTSNNIDDSDDYLDVYSVYGFWPYGD